MIIKMRVISTEPISFISPKLPPIAVPIPNLQQITSTADYNELVNKPKINGEIVQGDKESKDYDLYGVNNPETFVHIQSTPSARWEIRHNLNKKPSITVVDSAGSVIVGEYNFIDTNIVICSFSGAFSGECYLN